MEMTSLLQQAIEEVQKLPDGEQDAIAAIILEELAGEERWQQAFASLPKTCRSFSQVREDIAAGRVHAVGSMNYKLTGRGRFPESVLASVLRHP